MNEEIQQKEKIRVFAILIFVAGIIVAIASAAKMPGAGAKYPSTVPVFVVGLLVSIIAIIIWHKSENFITKNVLALKMEDAEANPTIILKTTLAPIIALNEKISGLSEKEICDEVDRIIEDFINPFVEKRKAFMDIHGLEKAADILLTLAYGERMLNRVWSAASDHHIPEATNVMKEVVASYESAVKKL